MSSTNNQIVRRGIFQDLIYQFCVKQLDKLDIKIGNRPGDIRVINDEFYMRMLKFGIGYDRLALGESYMDGQWECDDLLTFFEKGTRSRQAFSKGSLLISNLLHSLPLILFNLQTKLRSKQDISSHYDIGNDLFKMMLDRSMNYSCAYWDKNVFLHDSDENNNSEIKFNSVCETLDEAQMNKMILIAKKLKLKPGMKILDIGSGFGYLAKFLAINFDVHVIGITLSKEQYEYATTTDLKETDLQFLRIKGLNPKGIGKFEFRLQDYRDVDEIFDRIVSVGMIEHVGVKNYKTYADVVRRCLTKEGIFLLHTIGLYNHKIPQIDPWANKYIFPGGMLPYHTQLIEAFYGKFIIEDWHNLGYSYYRTLIAWHKNFEAAWPKLESKYGERFKRMWDFYLLASASIFKKRYVHLWQIVLSRYGSPGGYVSVR